VRVLPPEDDHGPGELGTAIERVEKALDVVPDDRSEGRELLSSLKRDQERLAALLDEASDEWVYEDLIYHFWHQSFKVTPAALTGC
jgi:hypothetical protein